MDDPGQVLKEVFDAAQSALRTLPVSPPSGQPHTLDEGQCWKKSLDQSSGDELRIVLV